MSVFDHSPDLRASATATAAHGSSTGLPQKRSHSHYYHAATTAGAAYAATRTEPTAFAPVSRRAPLARVSPVGRGSFAPTSRMVKEFGVGGDSLSEVKAPGQEEGLALAAKQDRVQSLMVPLVTTTAFGEIGF